MCCAEISENNILENLEFNDSRKFRLRTPYEWGEDDDDEA